MNALTLVDVSMEHAGSPPVVALRSVSLTVAHGEFVAVVGPSGSGKSSLLRCLNRLEEPSAGSVRFEGRDIRSLDPRRLRREAALVTQSPVLFEGTVRDNLLLRPAGVGGDFSEARLARTLGEVGLDEGLLERDASTLSGGEKQRVTIARALPPRDRGEHRGQRAGGACGARRSHLLSAGERPRGTP